MAQDAVSEAARLRTAAVRAQQAVKAMRYGLEQLSTELEHALSGSNMADSAAVSRPSPTAYVQPTPQMVQGSHTDTPGKQVFLSYARGVSATAFARWLKAELEANGWVVWLDERDIKVSTEGVVCHRP